MSQLFFDGRLTFTKKDLVEKGAQFFGDDAIYENQCYHHVEGHHHPEMAVGEDSKLYCLMSVSEITHRHMVEKYTGIRL